MTLRDLLECTLYVSEKLQDVINEFERQRFGGQSDQQINSNPQLESILRENCTLICESFMDKYILNAIGLEVSRDEMNNDDQINQNQGSHMSD